MKELVSPYSISNSELTTSLDYAATKVKILSFLCPPSDCVCNNWPSYYCYTSNLSPNAIPKALMSNSKINAAVMNFELAIFEQNGVI